MGTTCTHIPGVLPPSPLPLPPARCLWGPPAWEREEMSRSPHPTPHQPREPPQGAPAYSRRPAGSRPRGSPAPPPRCSGHTSSCPGPGHTALGRSLRPPPCRPGCSLGWLPGRKRRPEGLRRGRGLDTKSGQVSEARWAKPGGRSGRAAATRHLPRPPSCMATRGRACLPLGRRTSTVRAKSGPRSAQYPTLPPPHTHMACPQGASSLRRFHKSASSYRSES